MMELAIPISKDVIREDKSSYINTSTSSDFSLKLINDEWVMIRTEQAWFWTEDWQSGEREVEEYKLKKEYEEFNSIDDLYNSLMSE